MSSKWAAPRLFAALILKLVRTAGVEPATTTFVVWYSIQLSYDRIFLKYLLVCATLPPASQFNRLHKVQKECSPLKFQVKPLISEVVFGSVFES